MLYKDILTSNFHFFNIWNSYFKNSEKKSSPIKKRLKESQILLRCFFLWPILVGIPPWVDLGMGFPRGFATKVAKVTFEAAMIELWAAMVSIRPLPMALKRRWPWRRAVEVTEELAKLLRERCFGCSFGGQNRGLKWVEYLVGGGRWLEWFGECNCQYRGVRGCQLSQAVVYTIYQRVKQWNSPSNFFWWIHRITSYIIIYILHVQMYTLPETNIAHENPHLSW